MKTRICPNCGQEVKVKDRWHRIMCHKRPSDAQLESMRRNERLSTRAIAERCDVSQRVARNWLVAAGLFTPSDKERQYNSSSLRVLEGTAVCRFSSCGKCRMRKLCRATVIEAQWMLCELMDEQQVIRRMGDGIDLHQVAARVREIMVT